MKIVHPTDFSDCADEARPLAVQLARALGAELILLHVAVGTPLFREGLTRARELEQFFTTKPSGTGLGLAVSYGIVHDHLGTIDVQSTPGQGATFVLSFPTLERAASAI
jgi:nitrogen fixation/metabolism regulation signal transduction histidine kinase